MSRRSKSFLKFLPVIILIILSFSVVITKLFIEKKLPSNLNILANIAKYEIRKGDYKRFLKITKNKQIRNYFKFDYQNIYYKKQKWNGRIKYGNISYQALFTFDNSKTSYRLNNTDINGINFKIFNSQNTKTTYSIYIRVKNKIKRVFEKTIYNKGLFTYSIKFSKPISGKFEMSFTTKGNGIGAWINPRLIKKQINPKIVLFIVIDTLRYDHTSTFGYQGKTTPFLDELAKDSVKYTNAFSSTSWTLPAHVSLFSGKSLTEHKVTTPRDIISLKYPLLAEVFQKNGFMTAAFTGGGFVDDSYGFCRGFQYYSNIPGDVFSMDSAERVYHHFKNYLNRFQNNNLFIFLHTYQVHAPYKAPRKYINRINKNIKNNLIGITNFVKNKNYFSKSISKEKRKMLIDLYDASVLYTDEMLVGNVMNYLKQRGYYENATIVVLSDHGEEFYDHGGWEHGHTVYSELIRIPLVIKFPFTKKNKRNIIDDKLTSISDISNIILKETGLKKYMKKKIDNNRNNKDYIIPVLLPSSPTIRGISPKISILTNNFHFIYNKNNKNLINPSHKTKGKKYELYMYKKDINEKNNVFKPNIKEYDKYKVLVKRYLKILNKLESKKNRIGNKLKSKLKSLGYLAD